MSSNYQTNNDNDWQNGENNEICVDLHCHSLFSDGLLPPEQIAQSLQQNGVRYAALTDHDNFNGIQSFRQAMMRHSIGFISGIEITTIYKNYKLHILAYGSDLDFSELSRAISDFSVKNNSAMSNAPTIFLSTERAIELIHEVGGISFLAHPAKTEPDFSRLETLIVELKILGLDGIEAVYSYDNEETRNQLLKLAEERELIVSFGTDYHGQEGQIPGISVPLSLWKTFRDALIKSNENLLKEIHIKQKDYLPLSQVKWLSFFLKIVLPAALSLILFIITLFFILLPAFAETLLERKRDSIRELTQVALGVLDEALQEVQNDQLTLKQAQALAKNRIEAMRYGKENKDYFWLQDMTPRILMHPYRKDLTNQIVSDFEDARGVNIFVEFVELVKEQGSGYISYVWHWKDDLERLEPKESYIQFFEPWGWIIGTGIYVYDVQAEIDKIRWHLVKISLVITMVVLLLLLFIMKQGLNLEKLRNKAENLLNESMERYRALIESATEGALFILNGHCRYANSVMSKILKCSPSYLELLDINDIFPKVEANQQLREFLNNAKDLELPVNISGILERIDGSRLSCTLTLRQGIGVVNEGYIMLIRLDGESINATDNRTTLNQFLQLPDSIAMDLTTAIKKADDEEEVVLFCHRTVEMVRPLLESGVSSVGITNMISKISDAGINKFIDLYIEKNGKPPVAFSYIVMGSQGRESQTLCSDQDSAIIYDLPKDMEDKEVKKYFIDLAIFVCDWLEKAGYHKCNANNIASNPRWCQPLSVWEQYFRNWIIKPEPEQIVEFSIFFDFRSVAGEHQLALKLRNFVNNLLKDAPFFFTQVAKNSLKFKAPIRLFGTILPKSGKEHIGRLDLKVPAIAIVCFARLYALQNGILDTNTLSRLDAISRLGVLLDSKRRDIVTAYEALLRYRLWNQMTKIAKNEEPDNWLDPGQLGHIEDVILKECFKEIEGLHLRIQKDFLGL